jgi:hypothetical protein
LLQILQTEIRHAPDQSANPQYVTEGQNLTWQRVNAVVKAGGWPETVFILTWDDWGGYADHVSTPNSETVVDALHPAGFQLIGGSRIPMLMFGGQVRQGIEVNWHSHAVIPKTVIDLFGLAPFGVARVDSSVSLAGRIDPKLARPVPPVLGATIVQPQAPSPVPPIQPPIAWAGPTAQPLPELVGNGGARIAAPNDAVVRAKPPKLPAGL